MGWRIEAFLSIANKLNSIWKLISVPIYDARNVVLKLGLGRNL